MKKIFITAFMFFFTAGICFGSSSAFPASDTGLTLEDPADRILSDEEINDLMTPEKIGYEDFEKYGIGDKVRNGEISCIYGLENDITCSHTRMIGEATVIEDSLYYLFDRETGELTDRGVSWRDDLPGELPGNLITAGDAEASDAVTSVRGEVKYSRLYYISPESNIFPVDTTAENPCWITYIREHGLCGGTATVITDAVTGEFLGYGIKPPSTGYHTYYIPYVTAGGGHWSGIGLYSGSHEPANISVEVRSQDGARVSAEDRVMGAGEQHSYVVGDGSAMEGWVRIISDHPLRGLSFSGTSGSDSHMAGIPLIPALSTSLELPHVAQDEQWDTVIMICNPNNTDTTLTVGFRSRSGREMPPSKAHTIPAHGSGKYHVADMLPDPAYGTPASTWIGSSRRIAAFAVYTNLKSGGKSYTAIALTE